jgi:hypothetical protein
VLRAGDARETFGTRFPGEYVMTAVVRMLDAVTKKIHEQVDVGYEVVSAATEIAEHVLAYVRTAVRSGDAGQTVPVNSNDNDGWRSHVHLLDSRPAQRVDPLDGHQDESRGGAEAWPGAHHPVSEYRAHRRAETTTVDAGSPGLLGRADSGDYCGASAA